MSITLLGRNTIAALVVSTGSMRPYSSTGACFLVGNSTAAEASATTWLVGTNALSTMSAGYPSRTDNAMQWTARFTTEQANFIWQEWGLVNTTSSADADAALLNRKMEGGGVGLGTKTSAAYWDASATITYTT